MLIKTRHFLLLLTTLGLVLVSYYFIPKTSIAEDHNDSFVKEYPLFHFSDHSFYRGVLTDSLMIDQGEILKNQSLSDILVPFGISEVQLAGIRQEYKSLFDIRRIRAGKKYTILYHMVDSMKVAKYFFYDNTAATYFQVSFESVHQAELCEKEIQIVEKEISGAIYNSLYESILERGGSAALVDQLADIYGWQVDFFRIQKGDTYKVIYQQEWVEGEPIGIRNVLAASFNHFGEEFLAFYFDQGKGLNYYDQHGESLQKEFLKEPLDFTRISSRFSPKRFHPVQKKYKAHLGTDFAAPRGTPIRTVGDGVILEARYSKYNGNYVKVRHNGTYTTQYLHMSKIGNGIKAGKVVKRGQLIGYVGSTGLANGPHLCYRFWKNGQQVDALRVKLPAAKPIEEDKLADFKEVSAQWTKRLKDVEIIEQMLAVVEK